MLWGISRFRHQFYSTTSTNLNSAQVAFSNRIGINQISPSKLLVALTHPKLPTLSPHSSANEFKNLVKIGDHSLSYFTKEYLKSRFPNLIDKYLELGINVFLANKNILGLARFLGIDAACGIDRLEKEQRIKDARLIKKHKKKILSEEEASFDKNEIGLECFKALLGLIATETGVLNLRNFLDSRYFNNSLFDPKNLVRPLYPIPDLTEFYPNLVFRLHQESGRLSSNSMFIVGVYPDASAELCLGEGFGASQALAQHRAATEALRRMFLSEKRVTQRPSDVIENASDLLKCAL